MATFTMIRNRLNKLSFPQDVPKGLILFVNITPALLVKVGWPYFVPGRVRYGRRVTGCSLISFLGILVRSPLHILTI